jgi:DNA adenine methylase
MIIKSPLRYPGGKSRAIPQIQNHLPESFQEFREPFVGGGSVFLFIRQNYPHVKIWINDLNYDLYCFWKSAQTDIHNLAQAVAKIKEENHHGQKLFDELRENFHTDMSDFDRAVRFFVMNRISFSGTVDSGGYSEAAFQMRFTHSSIKRLMSLGPLLRDVKITHLDYKSVIHEPGEDVFVFLDPPYLAATKSRLYGKNGSLHTTFDHAQFAEEMKRCPHKWLITYDDSSTIRQNFAASNLHEWQLQYGMNNYKQDKANKGKELFITNYLLERNPSAS